MSGLPLRAAEASEATKDQARDINPPKQDDTSARDGTLEREESVASSHTAGRSATPSSVASSHTAGRSATPSSDTAGRSATPSSAASSRTEGRSLPPIAGGLGDTGSARGGWKVAGSEEEDDGEEDSEDGDEGDVFARSYMDGSG
jgi:hypothetical protein